MLLCGFVEWIDDMGQFEELLGVAVEVSLQQLFFVPFEMMQQYPRLRRCKLQQQIPISLKQKQQQQQ